MFSEVLAYDTETSDSDVRHGQVLEFGAVGLDPSTFEEISAEEITVRLMPYVVPSPEALRVTGFEAEDLCGEERLPEPDAARAIEAVLRPKTETRLLVTFHGVRFDDEILRTMMWRNLRDPWVTSGPKARRLDMLATAQWVSFVNPAALVRGKKADGEPSWRLQDLAAANKIDIQAHRAIGDARATSGLLRLASQRANPALLAAIACSDGRRMQELLDPLTRDGAPLYLFTHYGEPRFEPVLPIHAEDGQVVVVRLIGDTGPLEDNDAAAVAARLFKGDGAASVVKPKSSPLVFTAQEAAALGIELGDVERHAATAKRLWTRKAVATADTAFGMSRENFTDGETPEALIYKGFAGRIDRERAAAFHAAPDLAGKIKLIASMEDVRLREFGARLLMVHDEVEAKDFERVVGIDRGRKLAALGRLALDRPAGDVGSPWMTVAAARKAAAGFGMKGYCEWLDGRFGAARALNKPKQLDFSF